jgi:hypothetical protein
MLNGIRLNLANLFFSCETLFKKYVNSIFGLYHYPFENEIALKKIFKKRLSLKLRKLVS